MLVYYLPMISGEKCLVLFFTPGALLLFQNKEPIIEDLDVDYSFFDEHIWPILANRIPAFESLKVSVSAHQAAGLYFSVSALCVSTWQAVERFCCCLGTICLPGRQRDFIFLSRHCVSVWQAAELYFSVSALCVRLAGSRTLFFCLGIVCPSGRQQNFIFLSGSRTLFFCLGIVCPSGRQQNFIFLSWYCVSAREAVECLFSVTALNSWAIQGKAFASAAKYEHSPFFWKPC